MTPHPSIAQGIQADQEVSGAPSLALPLTLSQKLAILADAAKYDASCASSGAARKDSRGSHGVGSTGGAGICHSYAPDGRCISLLKVLLTNSCIYDCHYCINRRSSGVQRARFTPEEVVRLTLDFYKRNYIEGLFLSSGIVGSADATMELLIEVARQLREVHHFRGYIHLKTIPEASPELIARAGRFADRLSINIELPSQQSLDVLAPEKNLARTQGAMGTIQERIEEAAAHLKSGRQGGGQRVPFATGQSTQMLVGADASADGLLLRKASTLYTQYRLRRVYYSAFSPIPSPSTILPLQAPPLVREHRLYQADWLLRFYGFSVEELLPSPEADLDLAMDPKLAWALQHPEIFPVDVNRADQELLLRVPGLGVRSVQRLVAARRHGRLRWADLTRLRISLKKVEFFVTTLDSSPPYLDPLRWRQRFLPPPKQLELALENPASTPADWEAARSGEF